MAGVATPASPFRSPEIIAKENAIKARLQRANNDNKASAQKSVNAQLAAYKKGKNKNKPITFTKTYNTQAIKGADQGFTPSDYGVGAGAAIPYQIGDSKATAAAQYTPKPAPPTKRRTDTTAITKRLANIKNVKGL